MPPYTDKAGSRTIHAIQPVSQILARARSPQPLKATTRDTYISSHHALKCGAIASYHRRVLLDEGRQARGQPQNILKANIRPVFKRLGEAPTQCLFDQSWRT